MGEFVYDDLVVVMNNPEITQLNFLHGWGWLGRFTRTISLMLDYKAFGYSPYGYHLQNILWHLLSTLLLYLFFIKVSNDRLISFLGALFFAVHPIHVESVANISNRKDLLCMFFSILSFYFYIEFLEGRRKVLCFVLSAFAWYLALNSKEVAIVLPASFLIYEYIFLNKQKRWLLQRPALLLPFIMAGLSLSLIYVFTYFDYGNIRSILTLGGHRGDFTHFSVASTSARAFWHYIKLLLFPFNLSPDYIIELSTPWTDPGLIFLWCMKLIFLASPFYFVRKSPLVAFGLFWFIINYIPISNIVPLTYIVADRYMYIPSAGFCLIMAIACASLLRTINNRKRNKAVTPFAMCLIALTLIGYSIVTMQYIRVWENEKTLWEHAIIVSPMSYKAHNNIAEVYAKEGEFKKAIKEYNYSISIFPVSKTYVNRGNAYYYIGKYRQAINNYNKALNLTPTLAEAYYGLGLVYFDLSEYDSAIRVLNKAVKIKPNFDKAYNNLGNVYTKIGNFKEALISYNKAIEMNPIYVTAFNNRAYAHMSLGNYSLAIIDYEKVIDLGGASASVYYNLGSIYSNINSRAKELHFYKRAASLGDERAKRKLDSVWKNN